MCCCQPNWWCEAVSFPAANVKNAIKSTKSRCWHLTAYAKSDAGTGCIVDCLVESDQFEGHIKRQRLVGGQLVGGVDGRTPGIVASDAHLAGQQSQIVVP